MARFSVDGAGSTGRKRKKISGAAEESQSMIRDLTNGNHSQNQDGMVESEERVVEEVENEEGQEQEQEEESQEEEEEKIEEGDGFGTSNGSQTVVKIDTDVLDCPICCEPFRPPICQCQNGHAVCSPCCISLFGKCPVCSQGIGLIRCLALERIIESVQIRCINARYGCNTTLSYLHQDTHHKICDYRPCTCPISPCGFKGSSKSLSHHFQRNHINSAVKFRYDYCFYVTFNRTENPFVVLVGPDGRLFLLLNNNDTTRGSALSIICISSCNEKSNFQYELSVGVPMTQTTLKLKASVESTTEWKGVYPTDIFLFVPIDFRSPNRIFVDVSIKKCKPH
ncbi:hypothetical protein J5N97_027870 [Dioscorea zingiberensis]|uniref:RING-type E3 ubiquitin transferase n=1 Tax=Dioscorea zingiberensis TaxID=325984 RepID=A0A9D5H4A6_9LILI|nr:hypothetical protein J5N97_027870 [Dioscorea zingiberensis]